MIQSHTKQPTARTPGQRKNTGKKEEETMSLTITAITTDATEPVHTHLRNLPTGTVAIFAPRNTQPITLAKHVDDTWRGYDGNLSTNTRAHARTAAPTRDRIKP